MVHGFNFSELVFLPTLVFTYSNAGNLTHLRYQGLIL